MTTTEHPEKQLLSDSQSAALAEVLARWPPGEPGLAVEQPGRDVVVLAEIRAPVVRPPYQHPGPLRITNDDERHGDSLLGAAGAWACVVISVLLIVVLAARQLWLWWLS